MIAPERRKALRELADQAVSNTNGRAEYVTLVSEILLLAAFFDGHAIAPLAADAVAEATLPEGQAVADVGVAGHNG